MKKRRILTAFTTAILSAAMLITTCKTASAANESASIGVPSKVRPGEQFTVSVTFTSTEDIGSAKATLDYNSDVIEFVSGDFANGGGGLCNINGWADEVGKQVSFDLTFEAVSIGSTQLLITKSTIYNDLGDLIGKPVTAVTIEIADDATTTAPTQTTPESSASSEVSSQQSTTTTTTTETTTQPTTTTTTSATTTSLQSDSTHDSQPDETTTTTTGKASSDGSSEADESNKIDKSTITSILLIVGAVLIVGLLLTSGSSGGKGNGRKRRSSSRSSSRRRSSGSTRTKR